MLRPYKFASFAFFVAKFFLRLRLCRQALCG
jgi:hypothetical protein